MSTYVFVYRAKRNVVVMSSVKILR